MNQNIDDIESTSNPTEKKGKTKSISSAAEYEPENTIMAISPETKSILSKRARIMSIKKVDEIAVSDNITVIEFILSGEVYAIETHYVREVYPLTDFTVIPGLPPFVVGVINVRGQIISVINLKKLMNLPEVGLGELNKVIIIENDHMEFGILADVIRGTSTISVKSIQKKLTNLSDIGNEFLQGVTKDQLIIFDAEKLLNYDQIKINHDKI
jgi:purine-binding chemotaxis protein CheW